MAEDQKPFSGFEELSISEDLVSSPSIRPSQISTLDFGGLLDPPLRIQSDETECGGQLWPAGMMLVEYLLRNEKEELMGKTMFVVRSDVSLRLIPTSTEHLSACLASLC